MPVSVIPAIRFAKTPESVAGPLLLFIAYVGDTHSISIAYLGQAIILSQARKRIAVHAHSPECRPQIQRARESSIRGCWRRQWKPALSEACGAALQSGRDDSRRSLFRAGGRSRRPSAEPLNRLGLADSRKQRQTDGLRGREELMRTGRRRPLSGVSDEAIGTAVGDRLEIAMSSHWPGQLRSVGRARSTGPLRRSVRKFQGSHSLRDVRERAQTTSRHHGGPELAMGQGYQTRRQTARD
jgi:hypothetical protein